MVRLIWGLLIGGMLTADASAQTLNIASSAPVTSIDPHYHALSPNESLGSHIYERLVDRDAGGHMIGGLAESWKLRDDRTWEFRLRTATFHDGTPFTSEDVAYTLARIPRVKNSPASFSVYSRAVTSTEVVDPHTILLHTDTPYPLLPSDLSRIFIIPHTLGADPATEDFNSGKNAIGTAAYRFVAYCSGDRTEMERYDGYWGDKPHWQPSTIVSSATTPPAPPRCWPSPACSFRQTASRPDRPSGR